MKIEKRLTGEKFGERYGRVFSSPLQRFLRKYATRKELKSQRNSLSLFAEEMLGVPAQALVEEEMALVASEILKE